MRDIIVKKFHQAAVSQIALKAFASLSSSGMASHPDVLAIGELGLRSAPIPTATAH